MGREGPVRRENTHSPGARVSTSKTLGEIVFSRSVTFRLQGYTRNTETPEGCVGGRFIFVSLEREA